MKRTTLRILIGSLAFGASAFIALADYPAELLGLTPVEYWRLNEAGPIPPYTVLTNLGSLGAADNGSQVGDTAVLGAPGVLPGKTGLSVSGNARAVVPYDAALNPATFSAEGWFQPASAGATTCIMSQFVEGSRSGWLVYQLAGGWSFRLYNQNGTSTSLNITTTTAPVIGQWYHIAVTFDGATGVLYVNGAPTSGAATGYVPNVSNPLAIGARADVAFGWSGTAAEAALYSGALSAGTVAAHYAAATTNAAGYASQILAASPLGYWRLAQPQYAPVVAVNSGARGSAANAAYNPALSFAPSLRPTAYPGFESSNTAPVFDGATGSISCGTNASLAGPTDFSVMAWVKTTNAATGIIVQQRDVDGVNPGYNGEYMLNVNADGTVQFFVYKDDYQFNYATTTAVNDGNWHQVVAVRQGLNGFTYIDGTQVGSAAGTVVAELVPGIRTFIGRDMRDFVNAFSGAIDEVAIFDRALNQGAILSLYDTAVGSNAAPVLVTDPPVLAPATTIYATTAFTLSADIAGALPMTFRWLKNGVVVGAGRDYTVTNAAVGDTGSYEVIATNAFGSVTSGIVSVTINAAIPATITKNPANRVVYPGATASFTAGVAGTAPFTYQWQHAGTNLPGATTATLWLTNCTAAQTGGYRVGATNMAGGALSASATLTLSSPAPGSYLEQMVTNGPVAFWRLNETSGSTAFDYAGGDDGTISNAVIQGVAGPIPPQYAGFESGNTCYQFDGTATAVVAGSLGLAGPLTVSAWVNPSLLTANDIAIAGELGSWAFKISGTEVRFTTPGILDHTSSGAGVTEGVWQHLAASFDPGVAGGAKLYMNGRLIATLDASALKQGNSSFMIGNNQWGGQYFNGPIDEVAVYSKVLPAETIARMYQVAVFGSTTAPFVSGSPLAQTLPVGSSLTLAGDIRGSLPLSYQWTKDGVSLPGATDATLSLAHAYFTDTGSYVLWATNGVGSTNTAAAAVAVLPSPTFANLTNGLVLHLAFDGALNDSSGRGNSALAPAGAPPFISGEIGQGVHLATTPGNNYLTVNNTSGDLAFDETTSFSVGFWVRYTVKFNDVPIIGNSVGATWQQGWVFTDSVTTGKLAVSLASVANTGTYVRDPAGSAEIGDGTWHNVVGVIDRQEQMAFAYVDGVLTASWSIAGLGTLEYGNGITIGEDPTGNYGSATFDLDDLGIWRRALTAYDAASIYAAAHVSGQSFNVYGPVQVSVKQTGRNVDVNWPAGTLLQSANVAGPYTAVTGATAPFYRTTPAASAMFYRVKP